MRRAATVLFFLLLALPAGAVPTISWEDADQHVGEEVVVQGRILGVHCSPLSCLLAFEPTFNRFTAVVQARSFDVFPPDKLDRVFSGKRVHVHGTVVENDKKPEIIVESPEDLKVTLAERRQDKDEKAKRAEVESLERIADVLDQITALTERMAATQERMDALLAQLEQRSAALTVPPVPPPPGAPPPEVASGEPQPRPAFEALRSLKRGMSRADVLRLVGQPAYVEYGGGGWMIWYYGYGRSISFDARGRAQALVGFPPP